MSQNNKHTAIWDAVDTTPPRFTKKANVDGQDITSINATYVALKATEIFGPVGIGWGATVAEERFDPGAAITDDKGEILCNEVMHTIRMKFWYVHEGTRGEVEHYGHTPYIRRTRYGLRTDFDAPKKSMTDAMKKCLSMLGFCADIFLGLYDDVTYLEAVRTEEELEQADNRDIALAEKKVEFGQWCEKELTNYAKLKSVGVVNTMHKALEDKARRKAKALGVNPEKVAARFKAARDKRIAELQGDQVDTGTAKS